MRPSRAFVLGVLAMTLATGAGAPGPPKPRIGLEQIKRMFASMRQQAPWYRDGPLLWGYFFTAPDRHTLDDASPLLAKMGYRIVETHKDDAGLFWLHAERIERQTAASLDTTNHALYDFADQHPPLIYDGMDVGPVDKH